MNDKYTWPAFNIADVAIVGGVGALLLLMAVESRKSTTPTPATESENNHAT